MISGFYGLYAMIRSASWSIEMWTGPSSRGDVFLSWILRSPWLGWEERGVFHICRHMVNKMVNLWLRMVHMIWAYVFFSAFQVFHYAKAQMFDGATYQRWVARELPPVGQRKEVSPCRDGLKDPEINRFTDWLSLILQTQDFLIKIHFF